MDRVFYYVQQKGKWDGNDVAWLNRDGSLVYDLKKADMYNKDEVVGVMVGRKDKFNGLAAYPAHKVQKFIQFHVPLSKIIKKKPEVGDQCYLVCTRDTVGKNACFWCWNHSGYSCDTRNAQVFQYDGTERSRDIDVYVPVAEVQKKIEHRIDCQDLARFSEREITHVLERNFFKEEPQADQIA